MFKKSMLLNNQAMQLLQTSLSINNSKAKKAKKAAGNSGGVRGDSARLLTDLRDHQDTLNDLNGRKEKPGPAIDENESIPDAASAIPAASRTNAYDSRARDREEDASPALAAPAAEHATRD